MYLHVFIYSIYVSNTVILGPMMHMNHGFSSCFSLPIWLLWTENFPFFHSWNCWRSLMKKTSRCLSTKKQKHCLSSLFIMVSLLFKQRMTYCSLIIIYSNSCQSLIVEWFIVIKFQISCGRIWWYLGLMVIIIPYEWCIDISPLYLIYLVNPIFRYPVVISWDLMGSKPHPTIHFQVKSRQRQEAPLVFVRRE